MSVKVADSRPRSPTAIALDQLDDPTLDIMNAAAIRQFPVNFQQGLSKLLQNIKENFAAQLQKM